MSAQPHPQLDTSQKIDAKLRLLDYHRKAMEARRSLSYQGFLALVGFYFVAAQALGTFAPSVAPNFVPVFRWAIIAIIALLFLLYVLFVWQVEKRNASDRQKYSRLENELWNDISDGTPPIWSEPRLSAEMLRRSWATTWPVLTLAIFTIAFAVLVWYGFPGVLGEGGEQQS